MMREREKEKEMKNVKKIKLKAKVEKWYLTKRYNIFETFFWSVLCFSRAFKRMNTLSAMWNI